MFSPDNTKGDKKNTPKNTKSRVIFLSIVSIIGVTAFYLFYHFGSVSGAAGINASCDDCYKAYRILKDTEHAYYFGDGSKAEYQEAKRVYLDCVLDK